MLRAWKARGQYDDALEVALPTYWILTFDRRVRPTLRSAGSSPATRIWFWVWVRCRCGRRW